MPDCLVAPLVGVLQPGFQEVQTGSEACQDQDWHQQVEGNKPVQEEPRHTCCWWGGEGVGKGGIRKRCLGEDMEGVCEQCGIHINSSVKCHTWQTASLFLIMCCPPSAAFIVNQQTLLKKWSLALLEKKCFFFPKKTNKQNKQTKNRYLPAADANSVAVCVRRRVLPMVGWWRLSPRTPDTSGCRTWGDRNHSLLLRSARRKRCMQLPSTSSQHWHSPGKEGGGCYDNTAADGEDVGEWEGNLYNYNHFLGGGRRYMK